MHYAALIALLGACTFDTGGIAPAGATASVDGGDLARQDLQMFLSGNDAAVLAPDTAPLPMIDAAPPPPDAAPPPPPDAAPPPPDAAPLPDAGWTWDGVYVLDAEPTGGFVCHTWNRMRIDLTIDRVWFWSTAEPDTLRWTTGTITAPSMLHIDFMNVITGITSMNAWDATRTGDGFLTGVMTFTSGCAFDIEATRL